MKTSVAERLNGDLATVLTGRSDSHLLLAQLVQANAFVVALGGKNEWSLGENNAPGRSRPQRSISFL